MIDTERVRDYIKTRVEMLGSALGRKINEDLISIFQRNLDRFTIGVLRKAFDKAESALDRFPTPSKMVEIAAAFEPSTMWKYNYRDARTTDPETGAIVDAKFDPISGELLFKPQDCLEGREFLNVFRQLAKNKPKRALSRPLAPDHESAKQNNRTAIAEKEIHPASEDDEAPD